MRVLYFLSEFPALSETFILNQIEGLLDLGEDVRVVSLAPSDRPHHPAVERRGLLERTTYLAPVPSSRPRRALAAIPRLLAALLESPRTAVGSLRADRYGRLASSLELLYRATAARGALQADVVHCHYGPMGRLAVILRELGVFEAPVVTTFHGYDLRLAMERGAAVFAPLQRSGDAAIAISRWSRRRLIELGFDERTIIDHPVGVALDAAPPARPPAVGRVSRLLTVARLVPEKGLSRALDALAALRDRRRDLMWSYRVVGAGPLESALTDQIERLGLSDRVRLVGPADRAGVRRELADAELFLLPSEAEVLPLALMEAHAAGLAVVASDVGAVGEIVEHGRSGLLVAPGDVAALSVAVESLLDGRERRRQYGDRGREIVAERYEIGQLNRRLRSILTEAAGRPGRLRSGDPRAAPA